MGVILSGINAKSVSLGGPIGPTDPYFSNVTLLSLMNGANNSTTIVDSSIYADNKTAGANTIISTDDSKFGGSSFKYTVVSPAGTRWQGSRFTRPSGEPYTIETWFKPVNGVAVNFAPIVFSFRGGSSTFACQLWRRTSTPNSYGFRWGIESDVLFSVSAPPGGWNFFAVVIDSSNIGRLYVNGTLQATSTFPVPSGTDLAFSDFWLMNTSLSTTNAAALTGYNGGVRLTKGIARYTSNFTVPTTPFPTQ